MNLKFLLLALCGTFPASQIFANETSDVAPSDSTITLGDVEVVSAKKTRTSVLPFDIAVHQIPLNTLKVDSKFLDNRDIIDINGATKFMPGVVPRTTHGGFNNLYVRGFSMQLYSIDGVPDQRTLVSSPPIHDLSAIESIEVLRGPASVLYGQSVVGGVLNMVRKQPTADPHLTARLGIGSWNMRSGFLGMSGKLAGPFNYYASINYSNSDGWRGNGERRFSIYATTSAHLTLNDFLQLTYSFDKDHYDTEAGLPKLMPADIYNTDGSLYLKRLDLLPGVNRSANFSNPADFLDNRTQDFRLHYEHKFGNDLKVRDIAVFRYDNIDYFATEGLSYLTSTQPVYDHYYMNKGTKTYICLDSVTNSSPLRFDHVSYGYSNQLEAIGKLNFDNVTNDYSAGYSFHYLHRPSFGWNRAKDLYGPGINEPMSVYNPEFTAYVGGHLSKVSITDRKSHSIYLSNITGISDWLKVMLSARYDWYSFRSAPNIPLIEGTRDWEKLTSDDYSSIKNQAFSYRAGVVYMPLPSLSVYGSIGSFFKPNNTIYNDNTVYINKDGKRYYPSDGAEVFSPEKGYQMEAGLKYEYGILSFNASYFYIHKDNVVTSLGSIEEDGITKNVSGQVGTMHSKGVDADITIDFNGLLLKAGYAFTDARVGKIAPNDYISTNADRGNQYTMVPRNHFYATADYTFMSGILKGLGASLSESYQDKVYANIADNISLKRYFMTDLSIHYLLRNNVRISGTVNNLFNTTYYSACSSNQLIPGAERNVKLTLSYSF